MTELSSALRSRTLWLVCHDGVAKQGVVAGRSNAAIRPSTRARYERLLKALPSGEGVEFVRSLVRRAQQSCARLDHAAKWEEMANLTARDHGDWTEKTWDEIRREDPVRCEAFWNEYGRAAAPRGETLSAVHERADAFLQGLANRDDWSDVVAVTHPEVVHVCIAHVLQIPLNNVLRIRVDPLSVTRLSRDWMSWQLHGLNQTP